MKKLVTGLMAAAAVVSVGAGVASAQGAYGNQTGTHPQDGTGYQRGAGRASSLQMRADALGISVDELNKAIADGKTMYDIAKEKGLSLEAFQAKMREASKARWEERGLSAEEVQKRVDWQTERQADCDGTGTYQAEGGYGRQNRA